MRPNMRPCSQEMGFGMKISGFAAIGRYVSSWAVAHERRKETMPCFSSISTCKENLEHKLFIRTRTRRASARRVSARTACKCL